MIYCCCYFSFPLFEMLSLSLCSEGVCCKVVNTVHQQLEEIVHISCVCPLWCSVDTLPLAVWHLLINLWLCKFESEEFLQSRVPKTVLAMMHHEFEIGGIAHHHSYQVLIRDVKLSTFYIFVFRFLSFPFQFDFYRRTKTVNKYFGVLMMSTNTYRICTRWQYSYTPFRTKLIELGEYSTVISCSCN